MYSIIVPVRDRIKQLPLCLLGALWQDFGDYETVVVDFGAEVPVRVPEGVRLVRWEADEWNLCAALNIGIANAKGDRLVVLNADNVMAPDMLSAVDALLEEDARQAWCWQRFNLSAEGQARFEAMTEEEAREILSSDDPPDELGYWGHYHNWGDFLAVVKGPLVELGGYDERMTGWGYMDVDMVYRLEAAGYAHQQAEFDFKLLHQYHKPSKKRHNLRNKELMEESLAAGQLVRNGGPKHFERYRL